MSTTVPTHHHVFRNAIDRADIDTERPKHTVADDVRGVWINQAGWQHVEGELLPIHHDCMPSIGTTIETPNHIIAVPHNINTKPTRIQLCTTQLSAPNHSVLLRQHVCELAFAFITPLRA
jgi:hypothetical protein